MDAHNNFVQATPVFTILFAVSQVPGAPDDNRWAKTAYMSPIGYAFLICFALLCQNSTRSEDASAQYERRIGGKESLRRELQYSTNGKMPTVRFSVDAGFRGVIELRLDRTNGVKVVPTNGVIFIRVPRDGRVQVKSFGPFQHDFRLTGQFTNGIEIPNVSSFPTLPPPDAIVVDGGALVGGTSYPPEGAYIFFVGNEQDRKGLTGPR